MVNRRDLLRYGLAGAATLLPFGTGARPALGEVSLRCDLPTGDARMATAADGPMTTQANLPEPFSQPFRVPRTITGQQRADGLHVDLEMRQAQVEILPGHTTTVWGYDGELPGPTILAERGTPTFVHQRNALGVPTTVHLHGGHVPPDMDGHATDLIAPGATRTYRYPNAQAGATLWYHDHAMHATGRNVFMGLFGLYLLRDPAEDALGLPRGQRDLPVTLADRVFDADGQMAYHHADHSAFTGDVVLVNGVVQPRADVDRARYRLRLLNASNARSYRLSLRTQDGRELPLVLVGSDGGLLAAPATVSAVRLAPAERAEVVVDFSGVGAGEQVTLSNLPAVGRMAELARFDVGDGAGADSSSVPAVLASVPALGAPSVVRDIALSQEGGVWKLQGHGFDEDIVDAMPKLGATEEWRFHNPTWMAHPMHLHLVQFQVIDRDGKAPEPHERGWKDTVLVSPGETVRVRAQFTGFTGTYIYHCHNLEHEDHDMMSQFRVVDLPRYSGANRFATAAAVSKAAFPDGAPTVLVATGGDFPDALAGGPAAAKAAGPVLLVSGSQVPSETAEELTRLRPGRIVVLGGERAVPPSVLAELGRYAPRVDRLAGASRFATAAAVSREFFPVGVGAVYVATGASFPDALAGGAAAAAAGAPLLLVGRDEVPAATAEELTRLRPGRIVVLGGAGSVSEGVRERLRAFTAGTVERLSGQSRFATAAAVSRASHPGGARVAYVATGAAFPDALAGGPAAGREGAPLLLVERDAIPAATREELTRLRPERIVVLGGPGAVSAEVEFDLGWLTIP